tara:strand:+ start:150 stop:758 length:609 start_codon:yes stop_codon:yes gene_type:complete
MELELNQKLSIIQSELKVAKNRYNKFGKYNYRSAEDILEAIKPFLKTHKVSVRFREKYMGEHVIRCTVIFSDSVQQITATSLVAVDIDQKGMSMPQRFGAASSYCKKYALGNIFLIDDTQDADATNDHGIKIKKVQNDPPVESPVIEPLQKPMLLNNTEAFSKVVDWIAKGEGDIVTVKRKYRLSNEMEQSLIKLIKLNSKK